MILGREYFCQQLPGCAQTGDWSCFPPGTLRAKDLEDEVFHNESPLHVTAVCRKLRLVPIELSGERGILKSGPSGLSALGREEVSESLGTKVLGWTIPVELLWKIFGEGPRRPDRLRRCEVSEGI
jgi:hypothetical protein